MASAARPTTNAVKAFASIPGIFNGHRHNHFDRKWPLTIRASMMMMIPGPRALPLVGSCLQVFFFRQTLHHDTEDILQKSNQWCSWSVKWIFSIDYLASMEKSSITSPSLTCTGITDLLSERYVRREFKELLHGKQYVQVMIPQQVSYCNQKLRWKFLEDFRLLPVLSNMFRWWGKKWLFMCSARRTSRQCTGGNTVYLAGQI